MLGKLAVFVMVLTISFGARVEAQAQGGTAAAAKSAKATNKPAVKTTTRKRSGTSAKKPVAKSAARSRAATARSGNAARKKPAVVRRAGQTTRGKTAARRSVKARGPSARSTKIASRRSAAPARTAAARRHAYQQGRGVPQKRGGTRFGRMPMLPPPNAEATRTLSFYNVHTREALTVTFRRGGRYVQSELDRLNYFLRDSRTGEPVQMDPALFDLLWQVRRQLRSTASFQVLSGYRSPQTNAWLASVSSGVASDSLHMRGQAMDVRLPGRSPGQIRRVARALNRGGVGYYPRSGFVHLDTGPVRYW